MTAEIYQFPLATESEAQFEKARRARERSNAIKWIALLLFATVTVAFACLAVLHTPDYPRGFEEGRSYQRELDCQWIGGAMTDGLCWVTEVNEAAE